MNFYVYIIKRKITHTYYKGFSEKPLVRLQQLNDGECTSTRNKLPWILIYLEVYASKREALIREKVLKHYSHAQIEALIDSHRNFLPTFLSNV